MRPANVLEEVAAVVVAGAGSRGGSLHPHLHHFLVGVGVEGGHEGGAGRRPVFREQPPGLVANAAGVAERLRSRRPSPPLRRLL